MERITLSEHNIVEAAARAAVVLRAGGVVLYPTDTLYGLGVDALSDDAVAKVFAIKGRGEGRPVHAIVSDITMAEKFGAITDNVRILAKKLPRGPVTFIVPKNPELQTGIERYIATFGFRIPDNAFCLAMLRAFGGPITATSANVAGMEPRQTVKAILEQLNSYSSVLQKTAIGSIDLIIDAGELPPSKPSSVVEVAGDRTTILREGAVSRGQIEAISGQTGDVAEDEIHR